MPFVIPPFVQYQAPLFPLRGLWNRKPEEGDRFVAVEIDWGSYPAGQGVQFQLSGNSPVALSQIVALSVDNSRSGGDVQFLFSDSGFVLQVPAHSAGTFPVYTNGLMFYALGLSTTPADVTSINIHNSMPPTLAMQPAGLQTSASVNAVSLTTPAVVPIVPAPVAGTLNSATLTINAAGAGFCEVGLIDGAGHQLWFTDFTLNAASNTNTVYPMSGMRVRFVNGLNFRIYSSTIPAGNGTACINAYYTVP